MSEFIKLQNAVTDCCSSVVGMVSPSKFVISLLIMDKLKKHELENSPENNRIVQEKINAAIKGPLPKVGDEVDVPTELPYDIPGIVDEIDYNYEVVCGVDDFGNPFNIPFNDF